MTSFEERLDPQIAAVLQQMPPLFSSNAELLEIRRNVDQMFMTMAEQMPTVNLPVLREDRVVPGPENAPDVRIRIYRPETPQASSSPVFLWIHGGGFFLGQSVDNEAFCEQVVMETGAQVFSVEYRLAPECPFPAALEDCYAVLQWIAGDGAHELHLDTTRIVIGGVSAGGNLAAATALLARDRGGPGLCYQFLLVPVLDDRHITPSSHEVSDFRVWNRGVSLKAWAAYLANSGTSISPYAAPAREADLSGLPPAYIYVEAQDLLRDEDIAYATRLMQAGIKTELHVYPGMFHGAYAFAPTADTSQRAVHEHLSTLKNILSAN
ncbi:MAG: alpha/beta hydrolase [Anaerolineae bacterium]|nr:alpha/beta hydrolase [Anaerolineae bacterium]